MTAGSAGNALNRNRYQLPQADTVCGNLADGHPCALGPDGVGACRVEQICQPWFDGTTWHCTRPRAFGGRCTEGPVLNPEDRQQLAQCPHTPAPCQPARSLRSRRRLVSGLVAALALGVCLVLVGGSTGPPGESRISTAALVSPGPLSAHHATMKQGCSACHSAAEKSAVDMLNCVFSGVSGVEESRRCLECHHELGDHALHPHSLSPASLEHVTSRLLEQVAEPRHTTSQVLARLLTAPVTADSHELSCAACHHEHQGAGFDLTAMTNAQCQSCHSATFHSLSDGHPEFAERRRADLHFDHVTHLNLHFRGFERTMPAGTPRMQCGDCHTQDASGAMMELQSFEVMCASCHGPQIRDFDAERPGRLHDLIFLDTQAEGTDASRQPPFMELLLEFESDTNLQPSSLVTRLLNDGEELLRRRLHVLADARTEPSVIEACIAALKQSHFLDAVAMLKNTMPEDTRAPETPIRGSAVTEVQYGSWRIGSNGTRLMYNCNQHADGVLRAWIDLAARNAQWFPEPVPAGEFDLFDGLLRDLVSPESTGRCLKCHTLEAHRDGGLQVNWSTRHGLPASRDFTRFSHRPHLTLLSSRREVTASGSDERCESCHALTHDSFTLVNTAFVLEDGMPEPAGVDCSALGVRAVQRRDCAQCHTPDLAGDNCLQCHNYHIHPVDHKGAR